MKHTCFFIISLLSIKAVAQVPAIDSLLINEQTRVLSVYGSFGINSGEVFCDNIGLNVLSWSDTLIEAAIPDTGKGSAGPIIVKANGLNSEEHLLSSWEAIYYYDYFTGGGSTSNAYVYQEFHGCVRMDLHSILKNGKSALTLTAMRNTSLSLTSTMNTPFEPGKGSGYSFSCNYKDYTKYDTTFISGFNCTAAFDVKDPKFVFNVTNVRGATAKESYIKGTGPFDTTVKADIAPFTLSFWLDSSYMISYDSTYSGNYLSHTIKVKYGKASFLPVRMIGLQHTPSIISPKTNSNNVQTDSLLLEWNSIPYVSEYRVQLSSDTLVNIVRSSQTPQSGTFLIDSIVSSTTLLLQPLEKTTKYFWRVRAHNSEGEGRWSPVSAFTTGTSAVIDEGSHSLPTLTIYPNPAFHSARIQFSIPSPAFVEFTVVDNLGREVLGNSDQFESGINEAIIETTNLLAGTYIVKMCYLDQIETALFIKQ